MFIECGAIESGERKMIAGKVCGYPIKNDPNTRLMELINKISKIFGGAKTGSWGVITGCLIAP